MDDETQPVQIFQNLLRDHPPGSYLAVMMYIGFPLSLRKVEDRLHERGVEISHRSVRS